MPAALANPSYSENLQIAGGDLFSVDGAINIKNGIAFLGKATAGAYTLALPTAGTDDGKVLRIVAVTAAAHVVTTPATGYNAATHIGTFAAAIGNGMTLVAYNGTWLVSGNLNVTLT